MVQGSPLRQKSGTMAGDGAVREAPNPGWVYQALRMSCERVLKLRGPRHHINIRISHPGSKAQYKGHARNHGCRILMLC